MPNMNPAVNTAGANISFDYTTGEMKVLSSYGFREINFNAPLKHTTFTLEEGGSFDENTFVSVLPFKHQGSDAPVFLDGFYVADARTANPSNENPDRNRMLVRTFLLNKVSSVVSSTLVLADFTLTVQKLSPGYEAPAVEVETPLCRT